MEKINWRRQACAALMLCAATAIALRAQTLTTLYSFDNTDGANPTASLIQATNGNLYGATNSGGSNIDCNNGLGCGTVFEITPAGALRTVHSFNLPDGNFPEAGLVQASDGNFYGTTGGGGSSNTCSGGCGTVFKITPGGTLTTLHSFDLADGNEPFAALVQAFDGNLYGTTPYGGANNTCITAGCGTVFRITPTGTLAMLYSFCSQSACTDGSNPSAALLQASDGNFYGTASGSGIGNAGTVFKISPGGTLTTLYSFGFTDGAAPGSALVQAADGNFYGTTQAAGINNGGTIFRITTMGTLTTLYNFCSLPGCTDGFNPDAPLTQATDGKLYGTTHFGGANGAGTIFTITTSGVLTTLYSFCSQGGCTDGKYPAGVVQDTNGNFYGTTAIGGPNEACIGGCGTVFSLSVGLRPFVQTQPSLGKAGQGVRILGTNLTGATSVTFDGTPAVFHVVSPSFITATVPIGATSGKVQVVTPSGTVSSNVPFRVLP